MLLDFKFHHIGIATHNIVATVKYYTDAGYTASEIIYDPIQNVSICFLSKKEQPLIELVAPPSTADTESPVSKIIKKSGVSLYHICYEVNDIETAIFQLKKKKYLPLSIPVNAVAFDNKKIVFLYNRDVGLIELLEQSRVP